MFKQIIRDKRQPPTREENPRLSSAGTSPFLILTQEIYSHSNLSEERKEFKLTHFLPSVLWLPVKYDFVSLPFALMLSGFY